MLRRRLNRSRARSRQKKMGGEINMTPILDMTFLLLIAFIITFPALQSGITVTLPTATGDALPQVTAPLTITIDAQGQIFLGDKPVTDEELALDVRQIVAQNKEATAHIRGDEAQSYGRIIDVLRILRQEKLTKFSLITENQ